MAKIKRRTFFLAVTLVEQGVDGTDDGHPDSAYEIGGCYTRDMWRDLLQEILKKELPGQYTTEVEVIMMNDSEVV